jgi:hypothetical protein
MRVMENNDRAYLYRVQHGNPQRAEASWLTGPQRRRLKHKGSSPKTHSHNGLLMVQQDGTVRRQSCSRCSSAPRPRPAVGGTR